LVERLTHDPVGREPRERLHHRRAAHPEHLRRASSFSARSLRQFAADDFQEDAVVRLVGERVVLRVDDLVPEDRTEFRVSTGIEREEAMEQIQFDIKSGSIKVNTLLK
jgi:hypothetical protein